jgi:hypothetical protein
MAAGTQIGHSMSQMTQWTQPDRHRCDDDGDQPDAKHDEADGQPAPQTADLRVRRVARHGDLDMQRVGRVGQDDVAFHEPEMLPARTYDIARSYAVTSGRARR